MNQKFPLALAFDDVSLIPQYSDISSRSDVDLSTTISPTLKLKIPLIPTKMDTVTGVDMAVAISKLGGIAILPRFESPDSQAEKVVKVVKAGERVAAAVGCKEGFEERAQILVDAGASAVNIDVAHGHMKKSIEATSTLKNKFGDKITIISGIAATRECAEDLYKAGADSLLVGVGGSPICITRVQTGCGLPIFASLLEVAPVARKYKRTFIPDAGIRNSGDIVKALAAGASAIVGGYIFAGTKESPGKIIRNKGKLYKYYSGSASEMEKMKQFKKFGKGLSYMYTKHVEGVSSMVSYKGSVDELVTKLCAGIRSGLSYCGARKIEELWEKAKFIRVTQAGVIEGRSHDVQIIHE